MRLSKHTPLLFVAILFLVSSCFEIQEKVFLRKDGTGTFSLVIDMSQMKEMMAMMGASADDMEDDPFADMEEDFESEKSELEAIPGVSNARVIKDTESYRVGLSFDFDDIDALNAGVNKVFEDDEKGPTNNRYYNYRRGKFERTSFFDQAEDVKDEMASGGDEELGFDPSVLFADMNYTTVFEFEDKVDHMSNEHAMISADGKTVTFKYYFFKPEYEGRSVANTIEF